MQTLLKVISIIYTPLIISTPTILPNLLVCRSSSLWKQVISICFNTYFVHKIGALGIVVRKLSALHGYGTICHTLSLYTLQIERYLAILQAISQLFK